MPYTRLLILLIVMSSVLAARDTSLFAPARDATTTAARSTWMDRLSVGLHRTVTRVEMLQRREIGQPAAHVAHVADHDTRALQKTFLTTLRTSLPPPCV